MCFAETLPRSVDVDRLLFRLSGPAWRAAIGALYLRTGRYTPGEIKRHGAAFGFCDGRGHPTSALLATHVGWSPNLSAGLDTHGGAE